MLAATLPHKFNFPAWRVLLWNTASFRLAAGPYLSAAHALNLTADCNGAVMEMVVGRVMQFVMVMEMVMVMERLMVMDMVMAIVIG